MKRIIAIVLSLIMLVCFAGSALASITYIGTSSISANLSISSLGIATCKGKVTLYSGYTADLTVELYRVSGSTETMIKSWTKSGSGTIVLSKPYAVYSGYQYYTKTTAIVYNSSGVEVERPSRTSSTVTY